MAVRYFIKYYDVVDIEHRFNIYDDNYVGEALQVDGNVTLTYADTDDVLEAVRGQGLSVELEANKDLTFNDLWSEEEKTFRVEYKRNDVLLFEGWLNPEGFFENYVDTNWIVSFDCVDGLGYLSDLSFVEENGLPITGKKKYIELLSIALRRTGLNLRINTSVGIVYEGLSESLDILNNVYANTERYIKDDGETIMSCEEVIRDILEPFGACLTYFNGAWYIYKPNELYNSSSLTFFKYTYAGIPIGAPYEPPTFTVDFSTLIGSNWKGATLHHCNENQQIRNTASIGAYRINYKYGLVQSLLGNTRLTSIDGLTIDDWNIVSTTNMDALIAGESGVNFTNIGGSPIVNLRTLGFSIEGNFQVDFRIGFEFSPFGSAGYAQAIFRIIVSDKADFNDVTATKYYLNQSATEWSTSVKEIVYVSGNGIQLLELTPPVIPTALFSGAYMFLEVMSPQFYWTELETPAPTVKTELTEVRISPSVNSGDNLSIKGEFHTFQRTTKPSSKVKEIVEVYTGDNIADFYEGTIYKSDTITPTETWNRIGKVESKPLLQIMGEETLRIAQLPARVFSGDIFGFYNYLSVITIDGLNGKFIPIKYVYNTKSNIITADLKQIYNEEINDILYTYAKDYGNTVKPTIV